MFEQETATSLDLLYDVSHNLAKIEVHEVHGRERTLCVHRKGATRALPPHHPDLPADLAAVGQPVLIPGTMGTASYVLAGVPDNPAFFSTAHGAGRVQSRHQAARDTNAAALRRGLEESGILVRGSSPRGLTEEKPGAYKGHRRRHRDKPASKAGVPGGAPCAPGSGERLSGGCRPEPLGRLGAARNRVSWWPAP